MRKVRERCATPPIWWKWWLPLLEDLGTGVALLVLVGQTLPNGQIGLNAVEQRLGVRHDPVEQTVARDADVGDELDLGARLQVHLLGRGQWNSLKSTSFRWQIKS